MLVYLMHMMMISELVVLTTSSLVFQMHMVVDVSLAITVELLYTVLTS